MAKKEKEKKKKELMEEEVPVHLYTPCEWTILNLSRTHQTIHHFLVYSLQHYSHASFSFSAFSDGINLHF